jgi:hypothetical protein
MYTNEYIIYPCRIEDKGYILNLQNERFSTNFSIHSFSYETEVVVTTPNQTKVLWYVSCHVILLSLQGDKYTNTLSKNSLFAEWMFRSPYNVKAIMTKSTFTLLKFQKFISR